MRGPPYYEVRDCGYETSCWIWLKSRYQSGYGQYTKRDGHRGYAHRAYYEIHVGPIPEGLELDHLCRSRACVNPQHLEPVTTAENLRRGNGFAGRNHRKTHCIHGHLLSGDNLYVDPKGRRQCKECRRGATKRAMARYTPDEKREMYRRYREAQKTKRAETGSNATGGVL